MVDDCQTRGIQLRLGEHGWKVETGVAMKTLPSYVVVSVSGLRERFAGRDGNVVPWAAAAAPPSDT